MLSFFYSALFLQVSTLGPLYMFSFFKYFSVSVRLAEGFFYLFDKFSSVKDENLSLLLTWRVYFCDFSKELFPDFHIHSQIFIHS